MPPERTQNDIGKNGDRGNLARETSLDQDELTRYARHLTLPQVGVLGQDKLKHSSVLIIGAGGLGSPAALYLAAAGVGRIGLVDFDEVDKTNLQRQVLYGESDVGKRKTEAAKKRLLDLNPHIEVETHDTALTSANALEIIRQYDVVADGTDNFQTRYLVNDACVLTGTPNAYGSIFRFEGQASVFATQDGPCYRCLYPEPPPPGLVPSCAEGGVLGVLPGIVGSIQAVEAIKILLGKGETLAGRLLLFDALAMEFDTVRVTKDPDCPVCGENPSVTRLIDYDQFCGVTPGARPQLETEHTMSVTQLKAQMENGGQVVVVDVREPGEYEVCAIDGSRNIPLQELPQRLGEVPRDRAVVLHCKSGARSARAWQILKENGYDEIYNLTGGILAWAREVDPNMPMY